MCSNWRVWVSQHLGHDSVCVSITMRKRQDGGGRRRKVDPWTRIEAARDIALHAMLAEREPVLVRPMMMCAREYPEWLKGGIDALCIETAETSETFDVSQNLASIEALPL